MHAVQARSAPASTLAAHEIGDLPAGSQVVIGIDAVYEYGIPRGSSGCYVTYFN
jgi:hypothetical protein